MNSYYSKITVSELQSALQKLGYAEVPLESIKLILSSKTDDHEKQIQQILMGSEEAKADFIIQIKCALPLVRSCLVQAKINVEYSDLVAIARQEGSRLFRAINAIAKSSAAGEALAYLKAVVAGYESAKQKLNDQQKNTKTGSEYSSVTVYGSNCAICFNQGVASDGISPVINVEGAMGVSRNQFDWASKLIFQMNLEEIIVAFAVFQLKLDTASFTGHGELHDKNLMIEAQSSGDYAGSYRIVLNQASRRFATIISPTTAFRISALLYKQITTEFADIGSENLNVLMEPMITMYDKRKHRQGNKRAAN